MTARILNSFFWIVIATLPALAQEKLYPVRSTNDVSVLLTADRAGLAVHKSFEHKLVLSYPTDDRASILPDSRTPLVALWLRIQNVSPRPLQVEVLKFTSTDDEGRSYTVIPADEAYNLMMTDASGESIGSKTLRGLTLGRAGNRRTADEVKDDIVRYSIHSGELTPGAIREGFIYFEAPQRKKFSLSVVLGDLWSKPLIFSTERQR